MRVCSNVDCGTAINLVMDARLTGAGHAEFHIEGGAGISPPQNLEIEYGYYCGLIMLLDISMCHQNVVWKVCPRLRQKQSERI